MSLSTLSLYLCHVSVCCFVRDVCMRADDYENYNSRIIYTIDIIKKAVWSLYLLIVMSVVIASHRTLTSSHTGARKIGSEKTKM